MPTNKFNLPTVFVIFGITGDLMKKKILFALYHLYSKNLLPKMFQVVGFSRRPWSHDELRKYLKEILLTNKKIDVTKIDNFLSRFFYIEGDFENPDSYINLATFLGRVDGEWKMCSNKLFYLAVPPKSYRSIVLNLKSSGLTIPCSPEEGWTRVILEKPFGNNLKSALELDTLLGELFKEEQIYRVDHYLAKETVRNILSFRFSNTFLTPVWNNKIIEKIKLKFLEKNLVSTRGEFYDGVGALRDVGQNHLLQLLSLFTMENPRRLEAASIHNQRKYILSKLHALTEDEIKKHTAHGQYEGYRKEKGVDPESMTETYFKIETELDDPQWEGVPIVFEGGKGMNENRVEVKVFFKKNPSSEGDECQNVLTYSIHPDEKITLSFLVKKPGHGNILKEKKFEFDFRKEFHEDEFIEAYEKLILDMIIGNQVLFVTTDEVMQEWRFVESIIHHWQKNTPKLFFYKPGTKIHTLDESKHQFFEKEVGIIGLGKMGGNLAQQLLSKKWRVVGYNRTIDKAQKLIDQGIVFVPQVELVAEELKQKTKIIILSLTAGVVIDEILFGSEGLVTVLNKGDIIIDMGNTFYRDSIRRANILKEKGIHFIDVGISGGPHGALHGACLMVGGQRQIYEKILPLLNDIALPGGISFYEGAGAGHFVKMVHNGIEYGMMQSIAEGFAIMKKSDYNLDLAEVARIYNNGSVIESRLVGWLHKAYVEYGIDLDEISGKVNFTGEGEWTVNTAKELGIPVKILEESFKFRQESQKKPSYTGQIVSALRGQFGGHPVLKVKDQMQYMKHNKPPGIKAKIFLDSGDPEETKQIINELGFLDGQTTNPSLVAKNPNVLRRIQNGEKFGLEEIYEEYKKIVKEISELIPDGSVSIEVFADPTTKAKEMFEQGKDMFTWIPNAHIKFPTTEEGLKAAEMSIREGMRVNMTLCFTEDQAAAIYAATKGAKPGDVFISPFIGRLDDQGENGIDLIKNIVNMYKLGDDHVHVLSASIRNLNHLYDSIIAGANILTVPFKVLKEWREKDFVVPNNFSGNTLTPIPYKNLTLDKKWTEYDLNHPLTDKGIERFVNDWKALLK
ncbi:MAG TPA: glucose-6-phosphate dehydrogenase [Candidatus Nitrosocosmicus sp.]|nr:glucose-6-phosphate dehydrogenase [Candidatus Nitrosocosmicus sp.]